MNAGVALRNKWFREPVEASMSVDRAAASAGTVSRSAGADHPGMHGSALLSSFRQLNASTGREQPQRVIDQDFTASAGGFVLSMDLRMTSMNASFARQHS